MSTICRSETISGINRLALLAIKVYQKMLSPLKCGSCCRFLPTCSEYSREAFERHSFLRATGLTIRRLIKCQPFYRGILHDPVPPGKHDGSIPGGQDKHNKDEQSWTALRS